MKTAVRIINALGLFIVVFVLLLYLLIALPQFTLLQTYEITSGSMEPAILTGSLTFAREASFETINPGDIIVFSVGNSDETVTHRVTEVNTSARELITKGDANEIEDLRPVSEDSVIGKVIFSVPLLGFIEGFFTTTEGKLASCSLLLCAIILKIISGRLEKACSCMEKSDSEVKEHRKKIKSKSTAILDVLLILFICGALFALYKIAYPIVTHKIASVEYDSLEEYVSIPDSGAVSTGEKNSVSHDDLSPDFSKESEKEADEDYFPWQVEWPEVDFEALSEINPDVVAWLYVDGTQIDYPVVKGEDNDFYLHHSFRGSNSSVGCLFLDYRNSSDFSDLHANIYGHHINDGKMMLASIVKYKNQDFYDEHPYGLLVTPEANYLIEFFSGFIADGYDNAWQVKFSSYSEYESWLADCSSRSMFVSGITPKISDQIITLSTCTYEFNDARFVLYGILHREG